MQILQSPERHHCEMGHIILFMHALSFLQMKQNGPQTENSSIHTNPSLYRLKQLERLYLDQTKEAFLLINGFHVIRSSVN